MRRPCCRQGTSRGQSNQQCLQRMWMAALRRARQTISSAVGEQASSAAVPQPEPQQGLSSGAAWWPMALAGAAAAAAVGGMALARRCRRF